METLLRKTIFLEYKVLLINDNWEILYISPHFLEKLYEKLK